MMTYQFDFPCAYQFDRQPALFRQLAEDFLVEEELGFELTGSGDHLWLLVEKTEMNTVDAARVLARISNSKIDEIGYAGLKDKRAVTRQWFSVKSAADLPEANESFGGLKILTQKRNSRKLRKGSHRSNHFVITLKDIEMDESGIASLTERLSLNGVPNYFGPQRFGHSGNNMLKAEGLFTGKLGKIPRFQRGIYLSAARSYLFNSVLATRVKDNNWDQALDGDVMGLAGTSSVFKAQKDDEAIPSRLSSLDIHPTGPMWGAGDLTTSNTVQELESACAAKHPILTQGLELAGLKQERRPLRVVPEKLSIRPAGDRELVVEFSLPSGTYATSVLREMVVAPGL
jgi:tRNA pseudouridine13 synthase